MIKWKVKFSFLHLAPLFKEAGSVESLDLSGNHLESVRENDLRFFNGLKMLNLSDNRISSINGLFEGFNRLEVIDLSYNKLTRLDPNPFGWDPRQTLDTLILSGNKLQDVSAANFERYQNLRTLDLSFNFLTHETLSKNEDVLAANYKLEHLYLQGNNINCIPNRIFQGLFKTLDLSFNPLPSLNEFNGFSVEELRLNQMYKIQQIGPYTFSGVKNLQKLVIEDNRRLVTISSEAFKRNPSHGCGGHIPTLESLSLRGNSLENVEPNTFPSGLKQINLSGNQLNCTSVSWMNETLERDLSNQIECYLPGSKGKVVKLNQISPEELTRDSCGHQK